MAGSASEADPRIGTVLEDRYKILERIGDGAMGSVYRAERVRLGRMVAVKFLRHAFAEDNAWVTRFEREAHAMSRLSHPHCVSVMDFGTAGTPYIVMDFVTGHTLRELIDEGPVPVARSIHIVRQLLAALAHAHAQGIVHRDVKPGNVMLTEATGTGDHVRVLDFGLAKLGGEASGNAATTSKIVIGTPNYMSPEQARGKVVDARCDIYATGVVLYELLSGHKPFEAEATYDVLRMHQDEPVPPLGPIDADPAVVRRLDAIVRRAMAKHPDDRFDSAIEFSEALERALAGDETGQSVRSRSGLGAVFAIAVLAAVLIGGAFYLKSEWTEPTSEAAANASETGPEPPQVTVSGGERPPAAPVAPAVAIDAAPVAPIAGDAAAVAVAPIASDAAPMPAPLDAAVAAAAVEPGAAVEPVAPTEPDAAAEPVEAGSDAGAPDPELEEIDAELARTATEDKAGTPLDDEPAAETEPPPAPPPTPAARPVRTVQDAERLLRQGRREEALAGLLRLRRQQPRAGYIHYLIGNIYFAKKWWTNGLNSYRAALRYKPGYRRYASINNNAIRALASEKTRRNATSLILRSLGKSSVRFLRRASRVDKNPKVRKRAALLARKLSKRRR